MAKKTICPDCPKCLPQWLATFGDLMSLLLVFFILLLSMSTMDEKKIINYISQIQEAIGFQADEGTMSTGENDSQDSEQRDSAEASSEQIMQKISKMNKEQLINEDPVEDGLKEFAALELGKKGFKILIPSKFLFNKGSYSLRPEIVSSLFKTVSDVAKSSGEDTTIEIVGFADAAEGDMLNKFISPKNLWELAFLRAESVAMELFTSGVLEHKVKISSRGEFSQHDFSDNNQNRVVEIYIHSEKLESELSKNKKDFFDKVRQSAIE